MSAVDTNFYKEKKQSMFYMSLWFFILSLLVTILLYFYVSKIENETANIQSNIDVIDSSISELNSNENIQTYNIYEKNKGLLEKLSYESRVTSFVSHLRKNFLKYWVSGEGFSYSNGSVVVGMWAETNDNGYAYEKIVSFIRGYASDEKAIFELEDVPNYSGYDQIDFEWKYILK